MVDISEEFIDGLLANTSVLFDNIYAFECTMHSMPGRSHRGLTVTHQDLLERRDDFINELRNTMCAWVYSKSKYKIIIDQAISERGGDVQNAYSFVQQSVRQKFRRGYPQGQFGELLLFNIIQHYFSAVALLRKMSITTSSGLERHGADAIHYRPSDGCHVIYIGEAKTYASKYKFATAVRDAVDSILDCYERLSSELGLYVYDDFIDRELLEVARGVKNNSVKNVRYELVCVVSYEENRDKNKASEAEIKDAIRGALEERMRAFDMSCFDKRNPHLLQRLHFFAVPIWDLNGLMELFDK